MNAESTGDSDRLRVPLAPDCEAQRRALLDRALPPVWQLDPATARALHLEGNLAARAGWRPPLDSLGVDVSVLAPEGLPTMRRYRGPTGEAAGTLAWLHGGGWVLGGLETADALCRMLCALTGWDVVSVDYRLAPEDRFPAAVDDSMAAVGWLVDEGGPVAVGGDSAGATLSAAVAGSLGDVLAGQLLVYPATDPALRSESAREFVEGPFLTRRDMEWFYDQYLLDNARTDPRADLTGDASPGAAVPAVVVTVGHDPLRDEGIAYARALAAAGGQVAWIHAPELYHGAFSQAGVLPSVRARVEQTCSTLVAQFSGLG